MLQKGKGTNDISQPDITPLVRENRTLVVFFSLMCKDILVIFCVMLVRLIMASFGGTEITSFYSNFMGLNLMNLCNGVLLWI